LNDLVSEIISVIDRAERNGTWLNYPIFFWRKRNFYHRFYL